VVNQALLNSFTKGSSTGGECQIRQYDKLLIAQTQTKGSYKVSGNEAFKRLAGYIFGGNQLKDKIAMTVPVYQQEKNGISTMTSQPLDVAVSMYPRSSDIESGWNPTYHLPGGRQTSSNSTLTYISGQPK